MPRAVPCVSVSWTVDELKEEYVRWFRERKWKERKINDWFKDKHRGNKKLIVSKDGHMWLKRRLWLDGVSDRRRAKVRSAARFAICTRRPCRGSFVLNAQVAPRYTQIPWDCGTYPRVQVAKGWFKHCNSATFDTNPSKECVQQAGDVMNIMALDFLIDNHDRPGNCFVMGGRLVG